GDMPIKLHQHSPHNKRRYRFHSRRGQSSFLQFIPVLNQIASNCDVREHSHELVPQLPVKPAHHRDDDDEHPHADGDTDERDQCDDGHEASFGFEIPEAEEDFERETGHTMSVTLTLSPRKGRVLPRSWLDSSLRSE